MKAPVGLLSDRTVCESSWRGLAPTSSAHDAQDADNARKNTAFPPVCKKCAKVCKHPEKGKSHEESCDSSWDFGALEGTRIPGPLIKSQMLYRLSYERIFCSKTILPNNITTIGRKMQECRRKKRKFPHKRPVLRRGGAFRHRALRRQPVRSAGVCVQLCSVCRRCVAGKPARSVCSAGKKAVRRGCTRRGSTIRYDKMVKPKFR